VENNTKRLTDTVARGIKPPAAKANAETREINGKTVGLGHLAREYHWCKDTPGFGLLVSSSGTKTWVSARRVNGKKVWRVLGKVQGANSISAEAARKLFQVINNELSSGIDRVEENRQQKITHASNTMTVGDVWAVYLEERKPRWGDRHYADHISLSAAGGEKYKRGTGITQPGPLYKFMKLPLRDLSAPAIELWAAREGKTRPTVARLAWRCLKAFLGWCAEQPKYAQVLPTTNPAKTKKARESLGKPGTKSDALERGQLPAWFGAVNKIHNPVVAAALQTMLLTGARPGEVLSLCWDDINTQWKSIQIRDKVEGTREIPATPYVLQLLGALPRRNGYVFAGLRSEIVAYPTEPHTRACTSAGLEGLTLHGLRRSFKSLTEWLDIPAGVVAQLMGHKPSATAEKHYTVRPLDLLRIHHERIEAWILAQAGVKFGAEPQPASAHLRVVDTA
jgi:integrase